MNVKARAWVLATRPATLSAALVPVLVGSACAARTGEFHAGLALAALLGAFLIQIGTNLANDVFDHEKGADGPDRLGPLRVTSAGLLSAAEVKIGMWSAFAFATIAGLFLTRSAGWPVVAIGTASVVSGIAYTGGPYPLGYNGLGELFVLVFFGFVAVCGTAFVQAGFIPEGTWLAALAPGALASAVLVVNNLRDRETDARVGKRTLAVRFGAGPGRAEYCLLIAIAYAAPIALWSALGSRAVLLPWITAPVGIALAAGVATRALPRPGDQEAGARWNALLKATALLLLAHGVLLAIGIAW